MSVDIMQIVCSLKGAYSVSMFALIMALLCSKGLLRSLGGIEFNNGFRPFSPNWITVQSIVIVPVGFAIFFNGQWTYGFWLITLGAVLDRIDGKMAGLLGGILPPPSEWGTDLPMTTLGKLWYEMNFPGSTDLGKVLDPIADKVKVLVPMIYFAYIGILNPWLVGAMAIPELIGTLMRRPFHLWKQWRAQSKATGVGKWKSLLQWFVLILCLPKYWEVDWTQGWANFIVMVITTILAYLSVASKIKFFRSFEEVNGVVTAMEEAVKHDEDG